MKRALLILCALFCQLNLSALYIGPTAFFQLICNESLFENQLILEATLIQKMSVEGVNGEIGEFTINNIWCGSLMDISDTDEELPDWADDFVDTESTIWVVLTHSTFPMFLDGEAGDRFILTPNFEPFWGHYAMHLGSSPPLTINDSNEVTGFFNFDVPSETFTLDEINEEFNNCDNCGDGTNGIGDMPFTTLDVVPNPATDFISFLDFEFREGQELSIYSTAGQLISRRQISNESSIDVSALKSGLYFVEIASPSGERFTSTIVKTYP